MTPVDFSAAHKKVSDVCPYFFMRIKRENHTVYVCRGKNNFICIKNIRVPNAASQRIAV